MTVHSRPNVTRAAEGLDRRRFTVAEIEAMVAAGVMEEGERNELIGGELVPMSPKGNRHEVLKSELNMLWCRAAPGWLQSHPGDYLSALRGHLSGAGFRRLRALDHAGRSRG